MAKKNLFIKMTKVLSKSIDSITKDDIDHANSTLSVIKINSNNTLKASWEEVVLHINQIAQEENFKALGDFYTIGMLDKNSNNISALQDLVRSIEKFYQGDVVGICSFTNLTTSDNPIVIHKDGWNSCFWQGIGQTTWRIYESPLSNVYEELTINSGDFLYIPQGVYHTVIANEPRFALSFQFSSKNNEIPCCWNCLNID